MHMTAEERFWTHVDKSGQCWVWTAYRLPRGYGTVHVRPRRWLAHRFSWTLANGPIPEGMEVCHHCDNPPCVKTEPDAQYPDGHLFLGTRLDNLVDMHTKGREAAGDLNGHNTKPEATLRGEAHGMAKLTMADIISIRERYAAGAASGRQLASEYGVATTTISAIVHRKIWRHV